MNDILGVSQAWWTVFGIGLDIIGVLLLFFELFVGTTNANDLAFSGRSEKGMLRTIREGKSVGEITSKEISAKLSEYFDSSSEELRSQDIPEKVKDLLEDLISNSCDAIDLYYSIDSERLAKRHANKRRRLLFALSGTLVITGFVMQIIGAWPIS